MLLVQLRKALSPSTYVEIVRPIMYDERRIDQIGTSVNKFDSPEILIMLEY